MHLRCAAVIALGIVLRSTSLPAQVVVPPELVGLANTPSDAFDVVLVERYALVVDYESGLQIIDVTEPSDPHIVGSYDTPGLATHIAIAGQTAFVADHRAGGLQIIDVTNKVSPRFVASHVSGSTAVMIALGDGLAAVGYLEGIIELVDVATPLLPTLLGSYTTPGPPRDAHFEGDLLYVAESRSGLIVLDIANPSSPRLVSSTAADRPVGLAKREDVVYLADGSSGLRTFDVADPSAPSLLGGVELPGPAVRVELAGDYAVVADHVAGGLQIVDVSVVTNPSRVTGVVTGYYAHGVAVDAKFAYLVDGQGLKVFRAFDGIVPVEKKTLGSLKALFSDPR